MSRNSQLSDVLHVLLHMAESPTPLTSEQLAAAMQTNPVVLRRLMAGLRSAGFVSSAKGHGGGWVLSCPLDRITLRDVHEALGAPTLISLGFREDHPECLVAQAVHGALGHAVQQAQSRLLEQLGAVTLSALSQDFHQRLAAVGGRHTLEVHHHAHAHDH